MNPHSTAPLLFVNVDGVLTSARTYWNRKGGHRERIDPVTLQLLEHFCNEMGAEVVMASAWSNMFCTSPAAWRNFFATFGVTIPVVQLLTMPSRRDGHTWADEMEMFMAMFPNRPYVLFEDDPDEADRPNLIEVDAQVGLTTANLEAAARLLAPGCRVAEELASLNKAFSRDKAVSLRFNGVEVSVHPRDIGDALGQLGLPPSAQ